MSTSTGKKPAVDIQILGPGRIVWPDILVPQEGAAGPRYGVTLLLPPTYDTRPLLEACVAVARQAWGRDPSKWPSTARRPEMVIRKAEEKADYDGYLPGWHFISAKTAKKPQVVSFDPRAGQVTDPAEVYAGRWAKVSVRPYVYNNVGIGVGLGLNNIQLLKHDGVLGRSSAAQDFDVEVPEFAEEEVPF